MSAPNLASPLWKRPRFPRSGILYLTALLFITGCSRKTDTVTVTKQGYFFNQVGTRGQFDDLELSDDQSFVWYRSGNEFGTIDSVGSQRKIFELAGGDTLDLEWTILPFGKDKAWIHANDNEGFYTRAGNLYGAFVYCLDVRGSVSEVIRKTTRGPGFGLAFSKDRTHGAWFQDTSPTTGNIIAFGAPPLPSTTVAINSAPKLITDMGILDDGTIYALRNELFRPGNRLFTYNPDGSPLGAFDIPKFYRVEEIGSGPGQKLVAHAIDSKGGANGLYLTDGHTAGITLLTTMAVSDITVSRRLKFIAAKVTDQRGKQKLLVLNSSGEQLLEVDFVGATWADPRTQNFWAYNDRGIYRVVTEGTPFFRKIPDIDGVTLFLPLDSGICLYRAHEKVWLLNAGTEKPVELPRLTDAEFYTLSVRGDRTAFAATTSSNKSYFFDSAGNFLNNGEPIFTSTRSIDVFGANLRKRFLLHSEIGTFLLSEINQLPVALDFNTNPVLHEDYLELKIDSYPNINLVNGTSVTIETRNESGGPVGLKNITLSECQTDKNVFRLDIPFSSGYTPGSDTKHAVKVSLTQGDHTRITFIASGIVFSNPLYKTKEFTTGVLLLALCLLVAITQLFRRTKKTAEFSRWLPMGVSLTGSIGAIAGPEWASSFLDMPLLLSGLAVITIGSLAFGILSPAFFKQIANIEPFRILAIPIASLPPFRRRYAQPYLAHIKGLMSREEIAIENYTPIPAAFSQLGVHTTQSEPAKEILRILLSKNNADNAPCINISAPGGQGKSALLRKVLSDYIEEFNRNPALPVPIFINSKGSTASDIIGLLKEKFGRFLLAEEIFEKELAAANYLVIIDGLSESEILPSALAEFVSPTHTEGHRTPMLLTARPSRAYDQALRASGNLTVVVPERLNDTTVKLFEEAYLGKDKHLSQNLRSICRSPDGYYQPILVRLATIAGSDNGNIVGLYQATVRKLIVEKYPDNANEIIAAAYELCTTSYGINGSREISHTLAADDVIRQLHACGILISVGASDRLGNHPTRYRFLHDSIQTYLAVQGYRNKNDVPLRDLFLEFATARRFAKDRANFTFEGGNEMFQMAFLVYFASQPTEIRDALHKSLHEWKDKYATRFTIDDVLKSIPSTLKLNAGQTSTPASLLLDAINLCATSDECTAELYFRFAQVIASVVKLETNQNSPPA